MWGTPNICRVCEMPYSEQLFECPHCKNNGKDARISALETQLADAERERDVLRLQCIATIGETQEIYEKLQEIEDGVCELKAENAELRAVVEKLPKTADEKPIAEGDEVWWVVNEDEEYWGEPIGTPLKFVVACRTLGTTFPQYEGTHTVSMVEDFECGNAELYSTREAALAARGGEG